MNTFLNARTRSTLLAGAAAGLVWLLSACAVGIDAVNLASADGVSDQAGPAPVDASLARFDRAAADSGDGDFVLFGAAWPSDAITVAVMEPPRIVLPDLDHLANTSALVRAELGDLVMDPIADVELVACADSAAPLDGAGVVNEKKEAGLDQLKVDAAGSGRFYSTDTNSLVTLAVDSDGTGEYFNEKPGRLTTVKVDVDGAGEYYDRFNATDGTLEDLTTITIDSDGTAHYFHASGDEVETVVVRPDGSAEHYAAGVASAPLDEDKLAVTSTIVSSDDSWLTRHTVGTHFVELRVNVDGSGSYTYTDSSIGRVTFDGTVVDGRPRVEVPPPPNFDVDVRFPPLGSLGRVATECDTAIRLDESLLFESGSAELSEQAGPILQRVVAMLNPLGHSVTVAGHTDAAGSDASNSALSVRRAEVVEAVLLLQGLEVDTVVVGYGESRPIADNYRPDGTFDLVGMAMNRRVEIVIND